MVIKVAHDFICPWCWIAVKQADDLRAKFDVSFDWMAFELFPISLPWPAATKSEPVAEQPDRAPTPNRLDLAYAAAGMTKPTAQRPLGMRTHNAHQAVEAAKAQGGDHEKLIDRLYRAYWEDGKNISKIDTLVELAEGLVLSIDDFRAAIEEKRYADKIIGFDDDAYAAGVYNVPTFWIGGVKYAEQPTSVLMEAVEKELALKA